MSSNIFIMDQGSRSQSSGNSCLDSDTCVQAQRVVPDSEHGEQSAPGSGQQNGMIDEQVHVLYLDVPASDEPQVLDLSNLLAHDGIQMTESPDPADQMAGNSHIHAAQEVVIVNEDSAEIAMVTGQSEKRSAHRLSPSQLKGSHVRVSDILAAHHHSEAVMSRQEQNTSAEALLQLSSDAGTGTYIVDETGTMIPISQMRSGALLEVEDTGVTTIAVCQCWCGREFISQDDLDRHKLAHKYQAQGRVTHGLLKCTLCLESFLSNKDLRLHHTEVHPGGMPWECNICHRTFHKKIAMKAHMRVHNTLTRYQCSSCKKIFFYKTALNRHLKMHSCEKPFKCTICGDMYHSLWDLRKHRMNHQPPKLFACDVCTKVFKQKQTLFVHSRIHTGQKPYLCEVCCRSFSLKSTLVQHRRIHTGEKPNICHVCQRAFRQNSTLKAHLRTHTCLKPYLCRYCKLRFAYRDEVTEHEHSHTHNKTWQCEECGMWFKNQSLLARHSRVHTNERPFQCNVCNKTFVQSGSLQSHMRSHTKEKPYQCRICSKAYYTSGTLLVHIRKFHNVDAKSVREVFPVYNYIEDQKVFTIRNSLVSDLKPIITHHDGSSGLTDLKPIITHVDHDESSGLTNLEDLLSNKDNAIVEELVETSGEMTVQDFRDGIICPLIEEMASPRSRNVDMTNSCGSEHKHGSKIKVDGKEKHRTKKADGTTPKNFTKRETGLEEPSVELVGQDDASQSSHAAHDRQEAALGLAELALTGGEGMHSEKQPQTKTRTFFREEEEDEKDPNVTKIILSKEGGIMNSQDPHQCSVCGRIFGRKSIMVEHLRIHTDEKPYQCDFCQASFRQNAQLRSHIRNNHTQVERYQCSFCHNRFLSQSITIRHIHFHHKLKIKFCQNLDPSWTVDDAVWSDDNFELNASNTHFVKMKKKWKSDNIECDDSSPLVMRSSEVNQPAEENKYVVKVSLLTSGADSAEDSITACEHLSADTTGQLSTPINSATTEAINDVITSVPSDPLTCSGTRSHHIHEFTVGVSASVSQSQALPASNVLSAVSKADRKPSGTTAHIKAVRGSDFGNSRLLCGTCAMQFRGISSLRYHLRKVHKKNLDQSNVSYVYEDGGTLNSECTAVSGTEVQMSRLSVDDSRREETLEVSPENGSVKIVVFDDCKKCADEPSDVSMPYGCLMCCRRYSSKMNLEDHLKSHNEEDVESVGLHRCDLCAGVMKNTQQVTKHILKFHGVKQIYVCSICHREFFQQSSVYRHMKFLHKWEIKIRGEASIPVFVKPAPLSMHAPSTSSSVLKDRMQSLVEQMNRPVTKLSSCEGDSVTYISLDIGETDNLQIFKSDGHEVIFEVVGSGKSKTVKIKDNDLQSVKAESTALNTLEKTYCPTSVDFIMTDNIKEMSPTSEVCHEVVPGSATTISTSALLPAITINTSDDPLIVVSSDKSSKLPVSKEVISQPVAGLINSFHGNNAGPADDVQKVIKVNDRANTASRHQTDITGIDRANTRLGQKMSTTAKMTPKINKVVPRNQKMSTTAKMTPKINKAVPRNQKMSTTAKMTPKTNKAVSRNQKMSTTAKKTLKINKAVPWKKSENLPNVKPPTIMSAKDIGAISAGHVPRPGHQNSSKTNICTTDSLTDEGFCLMSATGRGSLHEGMIIVQVEEMKKNGTNQGLQLMSVEGIIDADNVAKISTGSSETKMCSKTNIMNETSRKRSGGQTIRGSCMAPVTSVQTKIKQQTQRSLSLQHVSVCEPASLSTQTANSGISSSLGGMVSHAGSKTSKLFPAVSKSGKQTELTLMSHSRSGRLIKRKLFDDELEEVIAGRRGRRL